ncbi:MAG: glycosyltransferase family 2 protein [Bacteroidaceae bacterium]|jgi:rhamnosyltransferase|nr:glycosyltransferase family 2 protein [Bacteroidaceae bacterium]
MKIGCILVLYNPDVNILQKSIGSILNQVDILYLADNSTLLEDFEFIKQHKEKILYSKMSGNIGIAAAQNEGLKFLIANGYDYVLFMDQDSIAPLDLVQELLSDLTFLSEKGINIGAIGPRAINRQDNKAYIGLIKKGNKITNNLTEVSEIISSASLIPVSNFKEVGLMDAKLFIDGVDHEWCWRAGYFAKKRFFISENNYLSHQLGEGDRTLLFKKVAIPTPFRTFYQYRNYLILIRRKYVPFYWKISNGFKYLIKMFYFPLCIKPRMKYLKNITAGIYEGIIQTK